ncbi:hypothetical protein HPO_15928 [Hyphomonas polymorpha PS728]|uniref:Uncharacterized protein n=1 Tax=Hyphomonas polymorpha PS728 TaxID=1280954 RepID=A0A062VCT7_9PROT|nr:hypothetical protein [Hyphomonas polymorpha]KCZ97206.1 hypothetical protein HPO_15928 [Hyphomonas polymorpha PS728]
MTYPRRRFGSLSLEVPPGLFPDDEAPEGFAAALTAAVSATLRIRMIALDGAPDLAEVLRGRAGGGPPRQVCAMGEAYVWPGLSAAMEGSPRRTAYAFESKGQVWFGTLSVPDDLWTDYAPFLEGVMLSLDIGKRPAPSVPLFAGAGVPEVSQRTVLPDPVEGMRQRLAEMGEETVRLILALRFDEAEMRVRQIDSDIYGANALADAYEAALHQSPSDQNILDRAVFWAEHAFPEPHTDIEAEAYRTGAAARVARLRNVFRV